MNHLGILHIHLPMQIPWYIHFCFLMENWDGGLDKNTVKNEGPTKETISLLQFYTYRLAVRQTLSPIFHSGKVFQQYIVDANVRMEAARLHYIWQNWSNLHVEIYLGLLDHVNTRAEELNSAPGKSHPPSKAHREPCNKISKVPWLLLPNMVDQTYSLLSHVIPRSHILSKIY